MTDQERWQTFAAYYGYPPSSHGVLDFQAKAGLIPTGELDTVTVELLTARRCGVSDALRMTLGSQWRKTNLNYCVASYLTGLPNGTQDEIYRAAWDSWQQACGIRLTQVADVNAANIILSTGRGPRSDFDGPSGVLAWMMLPQGRDEQLLGRFDLDETWVNESHRDIYLLAVACHEFGHALGLDHDSQLSGSLMAPYYKRQISRPQANDIRRIQGLYGPPSSEPSPSPTPNPTPNPGGSVTREIIAAIVHFAVGAFTQYAASTPNRIDDIAAKFLAAKEAWLVDLIMSRLGLTGTLTTADVMAILNEPEIIEQLKVA